MPHLQQNVQVDKNTGMGRKIPITNGTSHLSKENIGSMVQEPDGHIWGGAERPDIFQEQTWTISIQPKGRSRGCLK